MQFESNRMYRVKAVAEALDVSVNTIYRAIESGALDALKIGGAVRVPGAAVNAYVKSCGQAASAVEVGASEQAGEVA